MAAATASADSLDDLDLSLLAIGEATGVYVADVEGAPKLMSGAASESKSDGADHDLIVVGCTTLRRCVFGSSELKALAVKRGGVKTLMTALTAELSGGANEVRISCLCHCVKSFALRARVDTMAALLEADALAALSASLRHGSDTKSSTIIEAAAGAASAMLTPPTSDILEAARANGVPDAALAAKSALPAGDVALKSCKFLLVLLE
jgi:hypothetical protein